MLRRRGRVAARAGPGRAACAGPGTPADVRLVLGFSIAPSGRLTALDVKSTDRAVAECIAPLAAAWTFDPPLDAAGKPTSATCQFPVYLTTRR